MMQLPLRLPYKEPQEVTVLWHMRMHKRPVTPEQLRELNVLRPSTPITSYRRCFSMLYKDGLVVKCGRRMGNNGVRITEWEAV